MKTFKFGAALQIIYFLLCLTVIICTPIYSAFYDTPFGDICFRVCDILFVVTTFIPVGLIGTFLNIFGYDSSNFKKSKKALIWVIASPIILFLTWYFALGSFIYYTGGV